jgi:hypothetical protein
MWPGSALRFAELYERALGRLDDPRPERRVGAIQQLELLAEANPARRQAIVDLFCALLRAPGDDGAVRGTLQRSLTRHLRPGARGTYWSGASLDLTGAVLTDLDLRGCRIDGGLTLDRAVLWGQTVARGLRVRGPLGLRGTTFCDHLWLERAHLHGPVRAEGAMFRGDVWLGEAIAEADVSLPGAEFAGHAWFSGATVAGRMDLGDAVFRRSAGFRGGTFTGGINLTGTTFLGPARVSRRGDDWNVAARGWSVVVDEDNESVGQLLWIGNGALVEPTPV